MPPGPGVGVTGALEVAVSRAETGLVASK